MKMIFYLAGGLLWMLGLLQLAELFIYPAGPNTILVIVVSALIGIAYLYLGYRLFLQKDGLLWAGILVPLIGLLLTILTAGTNPFSSALVVLELLIMAICLFLFFRGRAPIGRVN